MPPDVGSALSQRPRSRRRLNRIVPALLCCALVLAFVAGQRGAVAQTTNLALNRPVTVSSSENAGAFPPAAAVDGNTGTRWSSAFRDPQWIYVDLGAARFVSRVSLFWERAASAEYEIQVSNNAVSWTTVFLETDGNGFTDQIDGLNAVGRYVRVFSTERLTQWGNSLYEIVVSGDTDSTCQ